MGANKKLNQEDIKQYVAEDLVAKIESDKAELSKLKFNHSVTPLDNPLSIRAKRRDVARLLTEANARKKQTKA
jgi:large subunit ribosomal protein L29